MPAEGVEKFEMSKILTIDEIEEITRCAVSLGISKVRLTGGEPLVRRGIIEICSRIRNIDGINELCLTTNGLLLKKYAKDLALSGVSRINVSLDTLDDKKYCRITRCVMCDDPVERIMEGIELCDKYGVPANKINNVLQGGINDMEVPDFVELTRERDLEVRFIELMPIGEAKTWDKSVFIPNTDVLKLAPGLKEIGESGVAKLYAVPGYKGRVGLISPVSHHFCSQCNRIRLTADGRLKACLHSGKETLVKGLSGDELMEKIRSEILGKPGNFDLALDNPSESARYMSQIGG